MTRYQAPTIKERGGLKVYLTSLGVDYDLFKQLRDEVKNAPLGRILGKGRDKPFRSKTISNWKRVDDEEQAEKVKQS